MAIEIDKADDLSMIKIWITAKSLPAFKDMVHRATNLWPDAPPEIKEFADNLIHGAPLQNYYLQDTSK